MKRDEDAFWFYDNKIVPIYEDDCHCYFLLFHYDEVGIPKELMEEFVKANGYESLRDRNIELYNELYDLEGKLIYFIESLGYELEYGYDLSYPMVVCTGETVFKINDIGFQEKAI